jgi:predicted Zn-dependent protease
VRMNPRLLIGLLVAIFSLVSYFGTREYNPVTGETQHISIRADQEIALGLQAAPQMAQQYGGESRNPQARALVDQVGRRIVGNTDAGKTPYRFEFHALADPRTINAFALPGGQVFITEGLLKRLDTEGQLAGVLGHEIGHVVGRHGAEHIAKQQLTQGLTGAAVLATYDPSNPRSGQTAAVAMMIGQLVNMKFGRSDELESDRLGVRFISEAGYDPRALIRVMEILGEASSGSRQPEFFSTHPDPGNRIEQIQQAIRAKYPSGVAQGLKP